MDERSKATLLLEDETIFYGRAIGKPGRTSGELVFNTGMDGYQEIFTDPSYYGQIVVMSTSHIGNYGVSSSDSEIEQIQCSGIVVKKFSEIISRQVADSSLLDLMNKSNKIGISDIDTRALVRHLRTKGAMNAIISTEENVSLDELKEELSKVPKMKGLQLANKVTIQEPITFPSLSETTEFKVALIDYGSMRSIIKYLRELNCEVRAYPMNTSFDELMEYKPDGVVLSPGPGDPAVMHDSIEFVKEVVTSDIPVFGINLGHQLIALSQGLKTEKMLHGHRGVNHPVFDIAKNKGVITSQNHSFVVTSDSVENQQNVTVTHRHLNDDTIAGIAIKDKPIISVQFHPEPSVGPHDSLYLFDEFLENMRKSKS